MATTAISDFVRQLTRQRGDASHAGQSDGQLVEKALAGGDDAALEAIVDRHGAMVYRVCWRVLRQPQDTEDAFQATFLVLAEKLRSIKKKASLASWLHGVAHRVAMRARDQANARRRRESEVPAPDSKPVDNLCWNELLATLDMELSRLPQKLRLPLILCYLESRTQDEAASQLGWSKSTLRRRLEEARSALGHRLRAHGVALPAVMSAVLVSDCIASAAPTPVLVAATVKAAAGVAAGTTVATAVSARVAALTAGVLKTMLLHRLKVVVVVLIMVGILALGGGLFAHHLTAAQQDKPPQDNRAEKARPRKHSAAADKPGWMHDLDNAKKAARDSAKDLLIVFTGLGWCHPCGLLDHEVLQQAVFVKQVSKDYVLVEFDFTFGDTEKDRVRAALYRKLQEKYLVRSFPTVILADADGVPYAMQAGYPEGFGVRQSLAVIRMAQFVKAQRDRSFKRAAAATGTERAEHLHKGLHKVAAVLGSLDDRGDDPVLVFYQRQIQDILKAGALEVRSEYQARQKKRDEWVAREAVFTRLGDFKANKDYRGALGYLDEQLKKPHDRDVFWRLEQNRLMYLEWDGQFEKALKNARRLGERSDLSGDEKESLLDREAYNLHNLKRVDELVAHYDRRIAAAKDDPRKRLDLLSHKAEWLGYHSRTEQTLAAWRAYREAAKPGSEHWLSATAGLAHELRKAGRHRAALELVSDYLARSKAPFSLLLDATESHIALGEMDGARAMIGQAEAASRDLRKSTNKSEVRMLASLDRVDERLKNLRKLLDTKKPK
jgi:RNA polymerase sigma factor (sigma-70 family)